MTLEQRAFHVLKEAHDLIKGESSFKTAQKVTVCEGEYWREIGLNEDQVEDKENECRPYVDISFEKPKFMDRQDICDLNQIVGLKERDKIWFDGHTISFRLIAGEPV